MGGRDARWQVDRFHGRHVRGTDSYQQGIGRRIRPRTLVQLRPKMDEARRFRRQVELRAIETQTILLNTAAIGDLVLGGSLPGQAQSLILGLVRCVRGSAEIGRIERDAVGDVRLIAVCSDSRSVRR